MILMYHKVDIVTPSRWWVSAMQFERQIRSVRKKYDFVFLDDYEQTGRKAVITFDDAYENIYWHAFPVLKKLRIPFEIFVNGDLIGDWNNFDDREMLTRISSMHHLKEMADGGARIQWHGKHHLDLTSLGTSKLISELKINDILKSAFSEPHLQWFAYPFGKHDDSVVDEVRKRFIGAVSVDAGSDLDRFQLNRVLVEEEWNHCRL